MMKLSELQLGFQLNHPRSHVDGRPRRPSAQDARWRLLQVKDQSGWRAKPSDRKAEIGVIEEVEKLEADAECGAFPTRKFRTLHDCEICIEVVWSAKTIAPLTERHRWTVADAHSS